MNSNEFHELPPEFPSDFPARFLHDGCVVPLGSRNGKTSFWVGWGESWQSVSPAPQRLSVYAPDFFLKEDRPWRVFPNSAKVTLPELSELLLTAWVSSSDETASGLKWQSPNRENFEEMFSDLQARLSSGEMKKAVPVVFCESTGKLGTTEIAKALIRALDAARDFPLNVYGFWNSQEGMLGVTPELLFHQRSEREFSTVALAGTRPHRFSVAERLPLLEDPKELEEHRFVVEGIASVLEGWGRVNLGETSELRLQKFSHLRTPIEIALSAPKSFDEIVRALHPTPALGAWPREAGMGWLEGLQRFGDRRRFGAPFGAINEQGEGVCWVAIRGLQWLSQADGTDRLLLGAGCGVTAKSELEREWNELGIKLESIQAALGL